MVIEFRGLAATMQKLRAIPKICRSFQGVFDANQQFIVSETMEMQGQKRPRQSSSGDKNPRPQKTKKQQFEKLRDARKIAVQSSSASNLFLKLLLTTALVSGSLDVNSFTSARSFEISALEKAMRSSKSSKILTNLTVDLLLRNALFRTFQEI